MSIIDEIFEPIYGLPCWNFKKGHGSFLTMEFGEPHLHIREPRDNLDKLSPKGQIIFARRSVTLHGDWHLWIYCCKWEVFQKGELLAESKSNDETIKNVSLELNGQKLVKVSIENKSTTVFEFDLGGKLITSSWDEVSGDELDELLLLYEPSGDVLILRSDGRYSHHPGEMNGEKDWKLIK